MPVVKGGVEGGGKKNERIKVEIDFRRMKV